MRWGGAKVAAGRIGEGHRIRVIAPSGAHLSLEQFDRARAWFTERGYEIRCDVPRTAWQRFSATDDERLAAIHAAAREDGIDAVMVVRGGYGLSRLLERIDWQLVAQSTQRGVRWVGYSDFTAFQLAMLAAGGAHSI
ncbi:MAG: LD-carboxypeptidase, partial [Burkholderiaceae bacterium]|nr:LD-carboxypeptidase [Burkholderiaceae bacterium]